MSASVPCPPANEYRRLTAGQASLQGAERLLLHLESCERCARLAGSLPEPDTLLVLLRDAGTVADVIPPAAVVQLMDRLSQLRPDVHGARSDEQPAGTLNQPMAEAVTGQPTETYDWLTAPQTAAELGRLGQYQVQQVVGTGGMGIVFRARDPHLDRIVAIKAMLPALASRPVARQRFLREARAMAAIKHDNIVAVYQVGEDRGIPFLAMEYLEGEPLDMHLKQRGKLAVPDVLRIGREMALGLAAAHQGGLIHRDIKPANIWLDQSTNRVKILDFGLVRGAKEEGQLTHDGAIVGTPAYMSPEQAQGRPVDHRCDLFSLGCVLYQMATGTSPFQGADTISTLLAVATQTPRRPTELEETIPSALSGLIMDLLAKDPADRPASARAVADVLQNIVPERPTPSAMREQPAATAPARPFNRRIIIGMVASLLLAGLAMLLMSGALRLTTKDGTIVLENLPADADVRVDGERVELQLPGDDRPMEIEVAPGKRALTITTPGFKMETRHVTIASGERLPISIRLEPLDAADDPSQPAVAPGANEYVQLFNGRDLTGWQRIGNSNADWRVEEGVLIGRWPDADFSGGSTLFTRRDDYQNFRFRAEMTLCKNWASSMVFLWRNEGRPKRWYRAQIGTVQGRDAGETAVLRQRIEGPPLARPRVPVNLQANEWFTQEVVVQGKQIRIYVNDVLRTEYELAEPPRSGHLGISLSGESAIRIRKIEVQELPAAKSN